MGCDIHFFVEQKNEQDVWESVDVWENEGETVPYLSFEPVARDYELFEFLAGVRGNVDNSILPLRGKPKDLSKRVNEALLYWNDDAHSITYYSLDELLIVSRQIESKFPSFYYNTIQRMEMINFDTSKIRCVMWFDS